MNSVQHIAKYVSLFFNPQAYTRLIEHETFVQSLLVHYTIAIQSRDCVAVTQTIYFNMYHFL